MRISRATRGHPGEKLLSIWLGACIVLITLGREQIARVRDGCRGVRALTGPSVRRVRASGGWAGGLPPRARCFRLSHVYGQGEVLYGRRAVWAGRGAAARLT